MGNLKQQTAEVVDSMGIDGTHTLYMAKLDGVRHWFKIPNDLVKTEKVTRITYINDKQVKEKVLIVKKIVKCSEIMEYYDETDGVKLDLKPLTPQELKENRCNAYDYLIK